MGDCNHNSLRFLRVNGGYSEPSGNQQSGSGRFSPCVRGFIIRGRDLMAVQKVLSEYSEVNQSQVGRVKLTLFFSVIGG